MRFGKHIPYTKAQLTGPNLGHDQISGLNDQGIFHQGWRPAPPKLRIQKGLKLHDILDQGVPKEVIPKDMSVTESMMKMRWLFAQRQVPDPEKDRQIYVEGMRAERLLPEDIVKRRGLKVYWGYDQMNVTTIKRDATEQERKDKVAGPVEDWHRTMGPDYWKVSALVGKVVLLRD